MMLVLAHLALVCTQPEPGWNFERRVDQGVEDVGVLNDSLRLMPMDLRIPDDWQQLYRLDSSRGPLFARRAGGLTAVFPESDYADTGNASVRREHLERIGGFDTSFRRAEDVELGQRLQAEGMRFVFEPTAEGFHYAERSFDSWRANAFAYGRNDVIFARRRGDDRVVKVVRHGYFGKNLLTRAVTRATLARPRAAAATQRMLRWLALGAARVGAKPIADLALSGIYITEYHRGTAAELGGHEPFFEMVSRRHRPHRDT